MLIYNETPVQSDQITTSWLSGRALRGRQAESRVPNGGPNVFFADANTGIGIIPIDDVYVVQALPCVGWKNAAGVGTERFALAPGKSYTLEWAIYPTGSGDYYDFINCFRKVEGRIGTVTEAPGFITHGPNNRRQVPTRDFIKKRGLGIGIISGLPAAADYPEVSIQGIEFVDFPKEMELLKRGAGKGMAGMDFLPYARQQLPQCPDAQRRCHDGRSGPGWPLYGWVLPRLRTPLDLRPLGQALRRH